MENCYRCNVVLKSENQSNEHIFLNAAGGRLKSKALLCRSCNSFYGESFDNEMASQLNFFANYLNIKRERGTPQDIKGIYCASGESAILRSNGSHAYAQPKIVETIVDEDRIDIDIRAKDGKETKKIIAGLKKKYPDYDFKNPESNTITPKENEPISFVLKIGVDEAHKSVVKSIINYYLHKGGSKNQIGHLLPYLDGDKEFKQVGLHLPEKWIYSPNDNEVSHVIRVKSCANEKTLYGYIELFNVYNYLVTLNDSYIGESIDFTYIYDVINEKEIKAEFPFEMRRENLLSHFEVNKLIPMTRIYNRLNRFAQLAMQKQYDSKVKQIISEVLSEFSDKNLGIDELPEFVIKIIEDRISTEIKPAAIFFAPTLEAPPANSQLRKNWLFEKAKKIFNPKSATSGN